MKGKNIAYEKGRARLQGFLSLITVLICTGLCPGQGNWTWNNPLPGAQLFSVDGKYVGLTGERWMTSMDGISWTIRPSRIQAYQNFSLYYGEGQFILGAKNGTGYEFSTSKDGLTWSVGTTITSKSGFSHIGGIVAGGGRYLATTSDNRLWVSENGRDWSQPDSTYPWSNLNLDIPPVFAADHFAILADTGFGSSTNTLWTSSDGRVWKRGGTLKRDPYLLLYGNNSFVALPQNMSDSCYVSKDGITWTAVQTGWRDRPRYGNFLDGEFLVYGPNGDIWGSTEGAYWYRNAQISSPIRQVVKGPGGFLAVREANPLDQDECPILSAPSINGP